MWEEVLVLRSVQYVRRKHCCLRHIMKNSIGQYCFKCSTFLFVIAKKHHYVKKFNIYCKTCSLRKKLINWSFPRLIIDENNNELHCSFSGQCPVFCGVFSKHLMAAIPPFHRFCHPGQSHRGRSQSFSQKSCKIYRFAEFFTLCQKCQPELLIQASLIRQLQVSLDFYLHSIQNRFFLQFNRN